MQTHGEAATAATGPRLRIGPVHVDLPTGSVQRGAQTTTLRPLERALLQRLYDAAGATVPTEELLRDVWGYAPSALSRTVAMTVARLRAQIEPDPARPVRLLTVHGEGYALRRDAPTPDTPVVGREALLEAVAAWVSADHGRLLTLFGCSGVGKTALLRTLAGQRWPGRRVLYVDVAAEGTAALPSALASGGGPRLVCVDLGALPIDDARPTLHAAGPEHTVLLAARAMLDDRHEAALPVPPLGDPAARALLGDGLDDARRAALLDACAGLPLALLLARQARDGAPPPAGCAAWLQTLRDPGRAAPHHSLDDARRSTLAGLSDAAATAWGALPASLPADEAVVDELLRYGVARWQDGRLQRCPWLLAGASDERTRAPLREAG